jgi:protein ImuB
MTMKCRSAGKRGALVTGPIMAVICSPALDIQAAWQSDPALRSAPLVITDPVGRVLAACPRAAHAGIQPGQQRSQAVLCCPQVIIRRPMPEIVSILFERLLSTLADCSPVIEAADSVAGVAYVAGRGLERLWHGWPGLIQAAQEAAAHTGLSVTVGLGPTRVIALALAHRPAMAGRPAILLDDQAGDFVRGLPLHNMAFGLPPRTLLMLKELGLFTIGDLSALPRSGLALRFGPEVLAAWEVGRGSLESPLRPYRAAERVVVTEKRDDAIDDLLILEAMARQLAKRLANRLQARAQAATILTLCLNGERGAQYMHRTRHWPPLQAIPAIIAAVIDLLAGCRPATAVQAVILEGTGLSAPHTEQGVLWGKPARNRRGDRLATILDMQARQHGRSLLRRWHPDPNSMEGWSYDDGAATD